MNGMQGLFMETHDKSPNIGTGFPMREDIRNGQGRKSKDFGELHLEYDCDDVDGVGVLVGIRDSWERHGQERRDFELRLIQISHKIFEIDIRRGRSTCTSTTQTFH
jgi:hypothetical protein